MRISIQKCVFYLMILAIVSSAIMGVVAMATTSYGWFEVRILLTTVVIAGASICGLACGASMDKRGLWILPSAGIALSGLAAGLIILGMWAEVDSTTYWKWAACMTALAVACTHMSLLCMAKLPNSLRWLLWIAAILIFGLAVLICSMIVTKALEPGMFRFIGVVGILNLAVTLVIGVCHIMNRAALIEAKGSIIAIAEIDAEIDRLETRVVELKKRKYELLRG